MLPLPLLRMMKTSPWNYLYLLTFSVCFGVITGFICAQYTVQSVMLVFALTFVAWSRESPERRVPSFVPGIH